MQHKMGIDISESAVDQLQLQLVRMMKEGGCKIIRIPGFVAVLPGLQILAYYSRTKSGSRINPRPIASSAEAKREIATARRTPPGSVVSYYR